MTSQLRLNISTSASHELDRSDLIAGLISGDVGAREILRSLELSGKATARSGGKALPRQDQENDRVGLWLAAGDGTYVRDSAADANERRLWAERERIAPCAADARIVLIGESVARGFLLDPYFTPAGAFETELNRRGLGRFEVVDLARTCLTDPVTLLVQSLALRPDAVVMFIGNNLLPYQLFELGGTSAASVRRRQRQVSAVGPHATRQFADWLDKAALSEIFDPILEVTRLIAEEAGIPILFVIPEVNRADWEFGPSALTELPGFIADDERAYGVLNRTPPIPRCTQVWRDAVKRVAAQSVRIGAIDLAELIAVNGGADRRLFYDYCHLTPPAIAMAMAAAATALTDLLAGRAPAVSGPSVSPNAVLVSPKVAATAAFLAAVHNAHWGQPLDRVRHWLSQAVSHDPGIIALFRQYVDQLSTSVPAWMDLASGGVFDPLSQTGRVLFNSAPPPNETDLFSALEEHLPASSAQAARRRMTRRLHRRVSLFDWLARDNYTRFALNGAVLRCHGLTTETSFLWDGGEPLRLHLVVRQGDTTEERVSIRVQLNGSIVAEDILSERWRRISVELGADRLRAGRNVMTIRWPQPVPDDTLCARVQREYVDGERDALLLCSGEIHRTSHFAVVS